MLSNDELNAAVNAGAIARADADRLAAFLVQYRATRDAGGDGAFEDSESIRFVRGLHDVFLTIGVTLLLIGLCTTLALSSRYGGYAAPFAVGIAAWVLAEYFATAKRLTLPSIALSIAFGIAGGFALLLIAAGSLAPAPEVGVAHPMGPPKYAYLMPVGMFISSVLFYLRFRVPFTLGQIVASIPVGIAIVLGASLPQMKLAFLALGLAAFALAMRFDLRDPERRTVAADNAFWLHLAAAPLIVHATVGFVWAEKAADLSLSAAFVTMAVIFVLAFVALVVDRRALLVSGLFYFGAALFVVIRTTSVQEPAVLGVTLLILGVALVLLGVGWRGLRSLTVNTVIPPALARRLPTLRTDYQ
jgi:hypothetical protein